MTLDAWLADHARRRTEATLNRRLVPREPTSPRIDLAGNDYLGLGRDARVAEAASRAALAWGGSAGASRLVTGTLTLHADLERALAAFTERPRALVFSTGYHANLAVVTALSDADTLIVSDRHIHASLVDACRLSRGATVVVDHNDVDAIEAALQSRTQARALVLVESVYSVLGDAAPLAELVALCERHDATLIVDEAHGIGVVGAGRGLVHALGLAASPHVVVTMTLSKALGSQGGAVLAGDAVIDHLINHARPFIFDTGLAPAATGAALEALTITANEPALVDRLHHVKSTLADAAGIAPPAGAVMSVPFPGPQETLAAQSACAAKDIQVGAFRPPSVPDGISRLRLTASAALSDDELAHAARIVKEVTA